jgi:hypothetical protein
MKFMRRTVKYKWQNYKTNDDIFSELKIIIKYIHSSNTSTTFYKVSTQTTYFGPLGPSSGLIYEEVPLILVHFGIPNCYKDVIKILCAN